MSFNLFNRKAIIAAVGAGALIVIILFVAFIGSCSKKEPTADELRLQHIAWLAQLLETYKQRYGAYPQPTAREETAEGIRHVWGYRPGAPSLASCTAPMDDSNAPIPEDAACGGGVYDINGDLIGWKGTLTIDSGLNSVEIAERKSGRVKSPLSELVQNIPSDPDYAAAMTAFGFGEYVYAVRNPDSPGSEKRQEYQIAASVRDPLTGSAMTLISGNYFVRADERDEFPASLIGPGLLFDVHGNAIPGQERLLQVLLDGQRKGLPNPALGDGEQTIGILRTKRRTERFLQAIEERIVLLAQIAGDDVQMLSIALQSGRDRAREILLATDDQSGRELSLLRGDLDESVDIIQNKIDEFLALRGDMVEQALAQETKSQTEILSLLQTIFADVRAAEESILAARDEILNYLDGEGIEEQTRDRVGRRLKGILNDLPNLNDRIEEQGFTLLPFLTEDQQDGLSLLAMRELTESQSVQESTGALLSTPGVFALTVASELAVHLSDLRKIVTDILDGVQNAKDIDEIDESLRSLSQALRKEHERISALFDDVADDKSAQELLAAFRKEKNEDIARAIDRAARSATLFGDFTSLIFQPTLLDSVMLDRSPGIPDLDTAEDPLRAEYTGIPYPLP